MYRVQLSEEQEEELKRRTRDGRIKPRTRDRLEMVRLSHAGFSIPQIAAILTISEQRVRWWIKRFLAEGFDALPDQPHRGQRSAFTPAIEAALRQGMDQEDDTWTARQVAEWVAERFGVRLTAEHWSYLLHRAGLSYKRTARSLKHKQDLVELERRGAALLGLEKRGSRSARSLPPRRSGVCPDTADGLPLVPGGRVAVRAL
jgi:putative transposase